MRLLAASPPRLQTKLAILVAFASVAATSVLRWLLTPLLEEAAPLLPFVLPVVLSAWVGGLGPGLLATLLSVVVAGVVFLDPRGALLPLDVAQFTQVVMFAIWGTVISGLNEALRRAHRGAEQHLEEATRRQDSLRRSEEHFRLLVEGVRDYAIFRLGPDGTVASWNAGAERLFGFSAAEAIGKPLDAFFPPEERAQVPSYFIEAATRGRWDGSGWRLRRDVERFRALDTLTAARDSRDSLEGYIYLAHNVSERLEIEQSLRRSEATLAALLESAAQAVIATDESGRITLANARAEEYFGYPRAELLGRSLDMLLPALPPGEAAKRVETVARRKDGSEFPVEVGMSRADTDDNVTAIAIITDITERKRRTGAAPLA